MNKYYIINENNEEQFDNDWFFEENGHYPIVCWWSGGITSAVACLKTIEIYGRDKCRVIFIDTHNEDRDTYRFIKDCEVLYGLPIESITSKKHKSVKDVWYKYNSLNVANGAVCSSEMKRRVRETWEKENKWDHQVFGFELDEVKRVRGLVLNHSHTKPIFPLMMFGLTKKDCIKIIQDTGIRPPRMYELGFHNNNCFGKSDTSLGGCVQGGIGYWQKMAREYPEKFNKMAQVEHELTDRKGQPVTMLKDQSKEAKESGNYQVFLKPHPDYPNHKDLSMMKGREVKPLMECNGFCGINDLSPRTETEEEINFGEQINLF
jgi:3'-phosphoadenosine 5'-phosphosulfate sulfotransferase (PAPS reductase)/FAD synthetase